MFTAIRNFFTAPRFEGDPERTQDARTAHRVSIALMGLALFAVPFILRLQPPIREFALYSTLGGWFIWFITVGLIKLGRVNTAKLIILVINTFNLFIVTFLTGGLSRPTITTTLFLLAMATLLFPKRGAINYSIVLFVLSIALFVLGRAGLTPAPNIPSDDLGTLYIYTFTLISAATLLAIAAANTRLNFERMQESQNELRDMNTELRELTNELEARVEERTVELEQSAKQLQKRAAQFEAIAQLARTMASIQSVETLLPRITELISQQFGFYHVGLFLLDESRQYAVLNAANSEGGQRMLARKHRLGVGKVGIVGYVTSTGNPRIALDTGADAAYFDNPDLPDTRSEMALPLRVGRVITGALDVQSIEPNAFSEDDVEVLSVLADEVSIAIENAHLYEESQQVLANAQSAFGEFTKEAWQNLIKRQKNIGYELTGTTIRKLSEPVQGNGSTAAVPIKLHNQVIGTINIRLPEDRELDADENEITQTLAERVGTAIENATLIEESRRRATRESVISDISAKLSASAEIEHIMQVAVDELRQALGAAEVTLKIKHDDEII